MLPGSQYSQKDNRFNVLSSHVRLKCMLKVIYSIYYDLYMISDRIHIYIKMLLDTLGNDTFEEETISVSSCIRTHRTSK
jgi:hypothetical protein